jgi:ABC-type glutathione transport system ATPase component
MAVANSSSTLLVVRDLTKNYAGRSWSRHRQREVCALRSVSLELHQGSTLAIVGESGAGKSTLARCIAGLEEPSSGEIRFCGRKMERAGEPPIQLIFQDPGASLNPRFSVGQALEEPLTIRRPARPCDSSVLLNQIGLPEAVLTRRTSELSGGQKARLALARALAALSTHEEPGILILDESFSSLDLSVQAQIINLLVDLQAQHGLTYLLIAHDLSLAGHLADEVAVMFEGEIVERGAPYTLFGAPRHPHTKYLVSSTLALPGVGCIPDA